MVRKLAEMLHKSGLVKESFLPAVKFIRTATVKTAVEKTDDSFKKGNWKKLELTEAPSREIEEEVKKHELVVEAVESRYLNEKLYIIRPENLGGQGLNPKACKKMAELNRWLLKHKLIELANKIEV